MSWESYFQREKFSHCSTLHVTPGALMIKKLNSKRWRKDIYPSPSLCDFVTHLWRSLLTFSLAAECTRHSCMYVLPCSLSVLNHSALQCSLFLETPLQSSAIILHLRERERESSNSMKNVIRKIYKKVKHTAAIFKAVFNSYKGCSYIALYDTLKAVDGSPLQVPPFKSPFKLVCAT